MTLFSTLHRDLEIPDDYHLTGHHSVKAPSITLTDRRVAIDKLHAAGEIVGKEPEDILHGMCARLSRLSGHVAGRIEKPIINKCPQIVAAVIADPHGDVNAIAARVGRDPKTIRRYRKQLREEGRI